MEQPLVSIIIATYNRESLILETLNSIKDQSYRNFECIIVDDGSSDNTENIIKKFIISDSRFIYLKRPNNIIKGHCYSRNYGFSKSKGDYINWFDDDDIMHPLSIEKKINKAIENDFNFVSCEIGTFNKSIEIITPILNKYSGNIYQNYYIGKISFYSVCALWKKSFLLEHKLIFQEKYKPIEDWYFNIEALFKTNNFFIIKDILVFYRVHEKSISSDLSNYDVNLIYQEFLARKEMYHRFLKYNIRSYELTLFYFERLLLLIRALLIKKDKRVKYIIKEFLRIFIKNDYFILRKIKTIIGIISYFLFKKGYRFLK